MVEFMIYYILKKNGRYYFKIYFYGILIILRNNRNWIIIGKLFIFKRNL